MSVSALPPLPLGTPVEPLRPAAGLPGMPPVDAALPPRPPATPGLTELATPGSATGHATREASRSRLEAPAEGSDRELADAFRQLLDVPSMPDLDQFETLIRATFRRTLAEHVGGPFDPPDLLRRFIWRLEALLGSRSYEEVVDTRMRRFRIEEIHLLDRHTLGLVSFASIHPARHAEPRKAGLASHRLATLLAGHSLDQSHEIEFSKKLRILVRPGRWTVLAALVRGQPDPLAGTDLDYALRRIESLFAAPLADGGPVLQEIQPLLEECLLIHSPPCQVPK